MRKLSMGVGLAVVAAALVAGPAHAASAATAAPKAIPKSGCSSSSSSSTPGTSSLRGKARYAVSAGRIVRGFLARSTEPLVPGRFDGLGRFG